MTATYSFGDVERLQGSVVNRTHAGAARRRETLAAVADRRSSPALGALTGNQAVQQVKAGLKAIYVSGWQVAADANLAGHMYPDQSLYPANSVPAVVKRINQALQRADQIDHAEGKNEIDWFAPIVADAEAGFGGPLNVFELVKAMIEAGAAGDSFRRSAREREKMRTHGRQGSGADTRRHRASDRRASGGRCVQCSDGCARAHGCERAALLTSDVG